jgi:hypothetical protein
MLHVLHTVHSICQSDLHFKVNQLEFKVSLGKMLYKYTFEHEKVIVKQNADCIDFALDKSSNGRKEENGEQGD